MEVFGKLDLNSALEGSHYVRSFHGIMMVSDSISSLSWEAFWYWLEQHGRKASDDLMKCAHEVQQALCAKQRSANKFSELIDHASELQEAFNDFLSLMSVVKSVRYVSIYRCFNKCLTTSSMLLLQIARETFPSIWPV